MEKLDFTRGLIVTRGVLKPALIGAATRAPSRLIVTRGVLKQFFHFPILFRFRMFESNTRYIELRKLSISTWRARLDSAIKINRPFPLGLAYFTYINRVNLFKQINNENFIYKSILFGII